MFKVDVSSLFLHEIPEYMHGGIIRFYEQGIAPGGFLCAVINNDLRGAVQAADGTNRNLIPNYVRWLYNEAPSRTWGYANAVDDYLEKFHADRAVTKEFLEAQVYSDGN